MRIKGVVTRAYIIHDDNPLKDLDMASYSLVRSYTDKQGSTYPELPWEPKESFKAVAGYYQSYFQLPGGGN